MASHAKNHYIHKIKDLINDSNIRIINRDSIKNERGGMKLNMYLHIRKNKLIWENW